MYTLHIDDETRRYIGDQLLAVNKTTTPISGLSEVTGISRVTLGKWTRNAYRLYWLTKHISDAELDKPHGRRYYTRDSRFFDKAQRYCERVKAIRAAALSGDLGAQWQRMERERRRNEHKRATA